MRAFQAKTCVGAWLQAVQFLLGEENLRAYAVVLEITDPLALPPCDRAVYDLIDQFLRRKGRMPISTVVNTIFPANLYDRLGADGIFEYYPTIYPTIQQHPDASTWGTYAMRMIERTDHNVRTIHPLKDLIAKLSRQAKLTNGKRAAYELGTLDLFTDIPIYDPGKDRQPIMGGPCLSHLSINLTPEHAVNVTGFYRSHYYVQRALGNFLGLAHLQHFIAKEAGIEIGSLVIHSSMAQLDTHQGHWGSTDVRNLIGECLNAHSA
jgi:hypothetical protein